MKFISSIPIAMALSGMLLLSTATASNSMTATQQEPVVPRFSVSYMDKTVSPRTDFYNYANGQWVKENPVPADQSRWGAFTQLAERNLYLLHGLEADAQNDSAAPPKSPKGEVGNFFASAMDTATIEKLRFKPIEADLADIDRMTSTDDLFKELAKLHQEGVGGVFRMGVSPDAKNSELYAFHLSQGGLSLPDRDYYLKDSFAPQRKAYVEHMTRMFVLLGETPEAAAKHSATVLELETELAKAGRTRVELRDAIKNYNKCTISELVANEPHLPWQQYLNGLDSAPITYAIVGQPEFFTALGNLLKTRSLDDWKTYLRWHVLHSSAPFLHDDVEKENFAFFGKELSGQQEQEPRWKRATRVVDGSIGEALGQLYVDKYYPPQARARMNDLVNNVREVFHDRLEKIDWMSDATRQKALAKFAKFTQKIGYPDKWRDYSSIDIRRDEYLNNIRHADAFEAHRELARIGKHVDRTEWEMTPPTVNAYFDPLKNEIVFPAGILQPPFFDMTADDPVNYGAIAAVIGHEITHGYDDQGRHYDAEGNLSDWWTSQDAKEFDARAQKVVDEYDAFEALPGLHVNGKLTLGENIADLGGVTIAYDAMERALQRDPSKRKNIDGFTPEQRFFISFAQIWRSNIRDAEQRKRVSVDPHSPARFRAFGPLMNLQTFDEAFGVKQGDPMWRDKAHRANIW